VKAYSDWTRRLNEFDSEFQLMIVKQLDLLRQQQHSFQRKAKGFCYSGTEDYLLRHGIWYSPEPWREEWERGPEGACYAHSLRCCLNNPQLRYVEGVAVKRGIPRVAHHAWITDRDSRLIDGVWVNEGAAYLGCTFPLDVVSKAGGMPLLDYPRNLCLLRERRREEDLSY
jgi:hypothetical protein